MVDMEDINKILKEVLVDIVPREWEKEELKKLSRRIIEELYSIIQEEGLENIVEDVVQVGSTARDTHLRDDYDIDIFVRFRRDVGREVLKETILKIGRRAIENLGGISWVEYAEHPYVSGRIGRYDIDIVPCYKIEWNEGIISAVDRTPLHNEFVKSVLKSKSLHNDIRLLKKFLKGIGIYGSDLKTKGFSGYLCELLVIHYGSFINTLKNAQRWKIGERIVLDEIFEIYRIDRDYKFPEFDHPLIVYDPVDLKRNVAAALSRENFCKFIFYSRQFLENPSREYFYNYYKKVAERLINRDRGALLTLKIDRDSSIVDDIIYPQMEKLQRSINKLLVENDFQILNCKVYATEDACYLSWEFLVWELPNVKVKVGPPVFNRRVGDFVKKHPRHFIRDCRVCAYVERKYRDVYQLFEDIVSGKLKDRIKYPKYVSPVNGKIYRDIFVDGCMSILKI
ncbi:MAG TPA: CCA tRNA nucleotidyltransferase [Methanothermococcus okinawensis]|uniref:CCA-adding enzyme n=1 Tax=Methanothermococcus okinawensis TaxID=155863 RepID=A0A832ZJ82_9EURY|nr:CCA tRNA nucleotidyltransferase [Methanothermococcus okinawensis]